MFRLLTPRQLEESRVQRLVVTVAATITEMNPDDQDHSGVLHQIFIIRVDEVLDDPLKTGVAVGEQINVAVRYGDEAAPDTPVVGLAVGEPITVKGAYIPRNQAYVTPDEEPMSVIHFTHPPVGWVEYHGKHYG